MFDRKIHKCDNIESTSATKEIFLASSLHFSNSFLAKLSSAWAALYSSSCFPFMRGMRVLTTLASSSESFFFQSVTIKHQEKWHLSQNIDTLTHYLYTHACVCDIYPQIGAYVSSWWSINDMLHYSPTPLDFKTLSRGLARPKIPPPPEEEALAADVPLLRGFRARLRHISCKLGKLANMSYFPLKLDILFIDWPHITQMSDNLNSHVNTCTHNCLSWCDSLTTNTAIRSLEDFALGVHSNDSWQFPNFLNW